MRTFLAIALPPSIHEHLAVVQRQLQAGLRLASAADCFNWVAPKKTHITLRFLGETTTQQATAIQHNLSVTLQQQICFQLTVHGVGAFPNFRRPNVLWLGIGGELQILQEMQQGIEALVQQAGFAAEQRTFAPHLTIARARRQTDATALGAAGRAVQASGEKMAATNPTAPTFTVTQIAYMQSELRPEGARYTPLACFGLQPAEKRAKL